MSFLDGPGLQDSYCHQLLSFDNTEVLKILEFQDMFINWLEQTQKDKTMIEKAKHYIALGADGLPKNLNPKTSFPFKTLEIGDRRGNNFLFKYGSDNQTPVA